MRLVKSRLRYRLQIKESVGLDSVEFREGLLEDEVAELKLSKMADRTEEFRK